MGNVVIDVLRIVDSGGNAGHISGAHARKFLKFGNLHGNIGDIALELHEIAVGGRPSVHPDYRNVKSGILSHELNEVGNLIGNALHAGFYQFLPVVLVMPVDIPVASLSQYGEPSHVNVGTK